MTPSPLVLLHGFTGGPASWDAVAAALPADQALMRPWLMGHGPYAWAPGEDDCGFEAEVHRLQRVIRQAGDRQYELCGYSMGGRVALGLALAYPQMVAGLTLIGAHPGLPPAEESGDGGRLREQRSMADERWAEILTVQGIAAFVQAWEDQPLWASQREQLGPALRAQQQQIRLSHSAAGLALALRALGLARMPFLEDDLPRLSMPVTLIVGAWDEKFTAIARRMAGAIGTAQLKIVENAGHNVVLEQPQAVAAALLQHLKERKDEPHSVDSPAGL